MLIVGVLAGMITGVVSSWALAPGIGWIAACLSYLLWVWIRVGRMDSVSTERHASREDPSRGAADVLLVLACLASLGVVVVVLVDASTVRGVDRAFLASLAIAVVALSWTLIHTLYMLKYASLYFSGSPGGVDFHQDEKPNYGDFAYLAFTLGMTYQVSDTDLSSRSFRLMALRHSVLSFLFGAVILATIINLIAGLG